MLTRFTRLARRLVPLSIGMLAAAPAATAQISYQPAEDWLGEEDDVMEMAGLWSINPQTLDEQPETMELGLLIVSSHARV